MTKAMISAIGGAVVAGFLLLGGCVEFGGDSDGYQELNQVTADISWNRMDDEEKATLCDSLKVTDIGHFNDLASNGDFSKDERDDMYRRIARKCMESGTSK